MPLKFCLLRAPWARKAVKYRYEEECNNIFASIGSPRINQDEIETLKGITAVFLATGLVLFFSSSDVPVSGYFTTKQLLPISLFTC